MEEEKSTPSNPVYKPITLPDFQNGNVSQMLRRICSANICSSLFVIVSFSPNRKLATPYRKRAYVRPRLKIATAATMVPEAQRHSGEEDQPRSRPRRARTNANPSEHLTIAPAQKRY